MGAIDKVFAHGQLPEEIPEFTLPSELISVKQLLLTCKLVSTGGEAKRMIKQSAATIDGEKLTDPNAEITPKDGAVIRVGKREFARLNTGRTSNVVSKATDDPAARVHAR